MKHLSLVATGLTTLLAARLALAQDTVGTVTGEVRVVSPVAEVAPAATTPPSATLPAVVINEAETVLLEHLDFNQAKLVDAVRLLSEISNINVVASEIAGQKKLTLFLQRVTPRKAIDIVCRVSGLWFREDPESHAIRILTTDEYQKDMVVFREDITRVFTLRHPNAVSAAGSIRDLYGDRVIFSFGIDEDQLGLGLGGMGGLGGSLYGGGGGGGGGSSFGGGRGGGSSGGFVLWYQLSVVYLS